MQRTPVPPESSYFQELGLALQEWVFGLLRRSRLPDVPAALLLGFVVAVAVLVLWLAVRAVLRARARRAGVRREVGDVVALEGAAAAALLDAAAWRAELERRLAAGRAAEALEAAWWWLARSVAGDRVEPDWTSRDLLAQVRRNDLTDVVRRLDVLTYGPERPGLDEVRTLVGRLEAVLA